MKQLLVMTLLAGTLVACGAAPSTSDGAPGGPAGRHLARMQTDLGLTVAQAGQISAIEQSQRNRMDYLRNSTHIRIRAVLTAEQAVKFDQMQQQRPRGDMSQDGSWQQRPRDGMRQDGQWQQRPQRMDGHRGMNMAGRMQQELGLSDVQVSQINGIQQSEREQMQALQNETNTQIRQLLSAEQVAKYDQMRRPQGFGGERFQRQRQY